MKKYTLSILALVLIACITPLSNSANAQTKFKNRYSLGASFTPEWQAGGNFGGKFSPSYGIEFDAQFSRHSGIVFGIYDRPLQYVIHEDIGWPGSNSTQYSTVYYRNLYHYISLRLGYKFFSDIINFSTSLNLDISANDKLNDTYGLMVSVSKDIKLCKGLILEPEIHVNPFMAHKNTNDPLLSKSENREAPMVYGGTLLGVGVKLKYRF